MRFAYLSLIGSLFLTGCMTNEPASRQATLNLDYASTSLGYRNSGALSAGQLYLWDQVDNQLVSLDPAIPLAEVGRSTPANLQAENVSGVEVSINGELSTAAKASIGHTVSTKVSFAVTDAVRVTTAQVYSAISQAYVNLGATGVDAFRAWRIADVTSNPDRYKFVLLIDPVLASNEELSINNKNSSGASFSITDKILGNVKVDIPQSTTARCSGTAVTCYLNARVMTVFINASGRLDYQPAALDRAKLSAALRR